MGEKAIGILAFQQLGTTCEIVTRTADSNDTHSLRLERGRATAQLQLNERRRARDNPGTTVFISGVEPEVLRVLTSRKVVEYLRRRRGPALARGDYVIEVQEGRSVEVVTPERPDGIRLAIAPRNTLWGRIECSLYVAPPDGSRRRVAVVGRAGTTIIDDLSELDEFEDGPWDSDQVAGAITFESLQQSAGRRAILRDAQAFPAFVLAVKEFEPAVTAAVEKVRKEVDQSTTDRLSDTVRKIFGRVLKELSDLDNPMRSAVGSEPGDGGLLTVAPVDDTSDESPSDRTPAEPPTLSELAPDRPPPPDPTSAEPQQPKSARLPTIAPDPDPGEARSRFEPEDGVVYFNDRHGDYLMVKDDEPTLLDYLATLVAKEYVVFNNPRSRPEELAEEMVRMLIRVRRHLRRR